MSTSLNVGQLKQGLKWHAIIQLDGEDTNPPLFHCKTNQPAPKSVRPFDPSMKGLCDRYECQMAFIQAAREMGADDFVSSTVI